MAFFHRRRMRAEPRPKRGAILKLKPVNPPNQYADWTFQEGCYVDSARGIYAIDAVISFAQSLGFVPTDCTCDSCKAGGTWSSCEFSNEVEDEATGYLNAHFEIESHSWGRNENADFGLWSNEEES